MVLIILAGCRPPSSDFVGKWEGKRKLSEVPSNPYLAASLERIELSIYANGTFFMKDAGAPKTGSAEFGIDACTMHVETFMGKSLEALGSEAKGMDQPIKLAKNKDGTLTLTDPTGFTPEPIQMRKTSATPEPVKR